MCCEYRGQRIDERSRIVQHRDSFELEASTIGEPFQFDIDIVERFHMVAKKTDRRDQDFLPPIARQLACDALEDDPAIHLHALVEPIVEWISAAVYGAASTPSDPR